MIPNNQSTILAPKVTVVTVTFNAATEIEATIKSVIEQSYPNIEYIIIDGGSSDGTLDIIRRYDKYITYWVSERDGGIYDAMNKGVIRASGDWINFLNCGDTFVSSETVSEVLENIPADADIVYGNTFYRKDNRQWLHETYSLNDLWKSMICCHQSIFAKTHLMKQFPFNTEYKISADFDFVYKCYVQGYKLYDTKLTIATHCANGISEKRIIKRMLERWHIVNRQTPKLEFNRFYLDLLRRKIWCILRNKEW